MPGILGLSLPKGQIEEAWRSSRIWKEAREDLCIFLCVCFSVQNMEHPYDTIWEVSNKMAAGSHFGWKVRGMKNNMCLALFSMPALCSWHGDLFFPPPGEMGCVSVLFYITWNISSLAFFHKSLAWHSSEHSDISQLHKRHREKTAYLLRLGFLPTGQCPALWKAAVPNDRKITGSGWVTG